MNILENIDVRFVVANCRCEDSLSSCHRELRSLSERYYFVLIGHPFQMNKTNKQTNKQINKQINK